MIKRILMVAAVGIASLCVAPSKSEAGIFFRPVAPVRRVAARTVLPPYPVARRVVTPVVAPVVAPVYRPVYGPTYGPAYGPALYGAPYGVGYGGVSITLGY